VDFLLWEHGRLCVHETEHMLNKDARHHFRSGINDSRAIKVELIPFLWAVY